MQEQKIRYFLALQTTYEEYQVGLFKENINLGSINADKRFASRDLILACQNLLSEHAINLRDLHAIIVNQGPAPFTSLRVILATANGLCSATGIPLVGVDGLKAFTAQHSEQAWPYSIALFNAFNNDVYYGFVRPEDAEFGYKNIDLLLHELHTCYPNLTLRFIGSGVTLFKEQILKTFGETLFIPIPLPEYCSLEGIAKIGIDYFNNNQHIHKQLFPLYLKHIAYKTSYQE